jgi:type II secretory pathway component PulK
MKDARGFALLAVLWVTVALATLVGAGLQSAQLAGGAAGNRISLERSRWASEACLAMAVASLDSAAAARMNLAAPTRDSIELANWTACTIEAYEPEARLNLDSATREMQERLDSLTRSVTGLSADSLTTHDGSGRVDVNAASVAVLAVLPGLGGGGARAIIAGRRTGRRLSSVSDVMTLLGATGRDSLMARYAEFERAVIFAPTCLALLSTGRDARAPPLAAIDVLVVPVGSRVAVVRRRMT